jgi:predicted flap endonuclease-1-like 5' DNA nuclease
MPTPVETPPPREVIRAAAVAPPARSSQTAFRRAERDTPDDPAPVAPASEPPAERPASARSPPATIASPVSAVAAAVAAAAAVRAAAAAPPPVVEPAPEPAPEPAVPAPAGDDLTRIRAIDAALATKLNDLGVGRYSDIAAWTSERVHAISAALGFTGRIERENWIEQAQILARGGATSYATGLASAAIRAMAPVPPPTAPSPPDRGPEVASRAAFAEPRRTEAPPPAAPAPATPGGRENLQRIGGISSEIEIGLNAHAITRYSQIAGWNAADVQQFESLLGSSGRISRENWIEQAQILARGGATAYSRIFDERGGPPAPAVVPPTPPAPPPVAEPPASAPPEPAPVAVVPEPPPAPRPEPQPAPVLASSAAETSPAERAPDLSGMRSVRSQAFRASDSMAPTAPVEPDDLKRIRGVGLLIERKLNAMGISTYEQVANWTADDVGTVNAKLEFKGRIERENWIEQARILASGGHTDFSRRFERGEV